MFNHIVLFKLKDFQNDQIKSEIRDQIKNALMGLKEKITELKYIEVGNNFELNAASFDISLITRFDSYESFIIYRDHPEHQKVVTLVRANTIDRAVVDYID
ncbi:MAG: Dabb family protein [Prolixibacteraceae bacterium]